MPRPAARWLIVGVGNDLRRDDGLGPVIARAAGRRVTGADVLAVHQMLPEHAEQLAGYEQVIIVDAAIGPPANGVRTEDPGADRSAVSVRPLAPTRHRLAPGHLGSPEVILGLLELLGHPTPRAWLVTVPAVDLEVGEGLSPAAAALVPDAIAAITRLLGTPHVPVGRERT